MGDRAPGLDTPRYDGGCFNCGSRDHFAYACPEPVRKEPHGAEVFRQRQAAKSVPGNGGKASPSTRSKGLVITRYAPPPGQYPPPLPPSNAWGAPGGPYPPPAQPPHSYVQQPPPTYPPATAGQPPYPSPYQAPNPPAGGYAPPIPPPPGPGPAYGQYPQPSYPPPPPPPQSYGPPGPYAPPPSYPPAYQPPTAAYSGAPPLPYSAPPSQAPPPATYPPSYGTSFPPGPPPPPPGSYPPVPYGPGYEPPASYPNPYPAPPTQGWQQNTSGQNQSRRRDHRDRRNDRDKNGRPKHSGRSNDKSQRGGDHRRSVPDQRPSSDPRPRSPRAGSEVKDVKEKSVERRTETPKVDEKATDVDEEFTWDLENAFVEVETKPADPVGKPLDKDWNDDPTIPPAYNAKCIKSAFYDPENPDAFNVSVRNSKQWPFVKRDSIFRYRHGMVVIRFPGSNTEYFTYHFSRKLGTEWHNEREIVPTGPSDPTMDDSIDRRHSIQEGQPGAVRATSAKRGYGDTDDYRLETKRPRNHETLDRSPLPRRPDRSPTRTLEVNGDPWAPQPGETHSRSPFRPDSRDRYSRSPGVYRLQKEDSRKGQFTPRDATQRYDSGYHSAYSGDRPYRGRSHSRHLSPPPSRRGRDSRDRSRERSPRKWSPSYARARSRTRSPTPLAMASDSESADLSDLDFELLGMERPEKKRATPSKPAVKRRQVKLNDAFGRRW